MRTINMKNLRHPILALCLFAYAYTSGAADQITAAPQLIALENATVIDGRGNPPLPGHTVLLEGTQIKAVFPTGKQRLPEQTLALDLHDKYIIPGLIDSHVHLATDPDQGDDVATTMRNLGLYLRGGVTAVRDMGGDARILTYLARQTLIDRVDGPDIYYSTVIGGSELFNDPRTLSSAKGYTAGTTPWMRAIDEQSDLTTLLAQAKGTGSTGIKIYRHVASELIAPLVRRSELQGLMSWAHLDVNPATPQAIADAGVTSVSHAAYFLGRDREEQDRWREGLSYSPDELKSPEVDTLIKSLADNGVILDATLVVFARQATASKEPYYLNADKAGVGLTGKAYRAGVKIAAGTDLGVGKERNLPPVHEELALLVKRAGLTPLDAIEAATSHGAQVLGKSDEFGAVAQGLNANLLILNSDPSVDIENTRDIAHVIKNGRFIYRGFGGMNLPFSDARALDGQLWLSGQIGNLPGTLTLVKGGIEAETAQALRNMDSVLQMHGLSRKSVRKCTVMLADISEWGRANEIYRAYFSTEPMPARSAFASSGLALGARVELECVAQR